MYKLRKAKKKVFDWNHISPPLTEEVNELKCYYCIYHCKCWAYKQVTKRLRKYK